METCSFFTFYRLRKKQLSDRFQGKVLSAFKAVKIIPNNLEQCKAEDEALVLEYYNEGLPSLSTFQQELKLWKRCLTNENNKRRSLSQVISVISENQIRKIFPRVFEALLVTPATSASVERSNSALRYIKNIYRNSISESRLNALILICVHRYIKLYYDKIIDLFAAKHPRRMPLILPEKPSK